MKTYQLMPSPFTINAKELLTNQNPVNPLPIQNSYQSTPCHPTRRTEMIKCNFFLQALLFNQSFSALGDAFIACLSPSNQLGVSPVNAKFMSYSADPTFLDVCITCNLSFACHSIKKLCLIKDSGPWIQFCKNWVCWCYMSIKANQQYHAFPRQGAWSC